MLRRLEAGFAVIGDVQFLPGYSVFLVDDSAVQRLSELPRSKRLAFLSDMDRLGEAVERVCKRLDPAFRRVNLESNSVLHSVEYEADPRRRPLTYDEVQALFDAADARPGPNTRPGPERGLGGSA